jgi:hypothetical protein
MEPNEEPKPGEVTWQTDEPITSLDQCMLAKALRKRLRRAGKAGFVWDEKIAQITEAIKTWENRPRTSSSAS